MNTNGVYSKPERLGLNHPNRLAPSVTMPTMQAQLVQLEKIIN